MAVVTLDAWGEEDAALHRGRDESTATTSGRSASQPGLSPCASPATRRLLPEVLSPIAIGTWAERGDLPTLRALCMGFLGRHIDAVVAQLGRQLGPLPSDVKACLLCVARRRSILTNRVLLSLADEGWNLLDLRGASGLSERAVRQALMRCPNLRALDLTGVANATAALLRDLPSLCPALELLAVGGSKAMEAAVLEVLPDILPHMRVREDSQEGMQDSWEDATAGGRVQLPDPGLPCGLHRLRLLVWPGAPALVHHTVQTVSPRVEVADCLPALQPPPQLHGRVGNDEAETASRAVSRKSLMKTISGRENPAAAAAKTTPASPAGGISGAQACKGTINVLRVRTAGEQTSSGGSSSHSSGTEAWRRVAGFGAGGGKYMAPHLRHRRQQPPSPPRQQAQQAEAAEGRRQVLLADAAAVIARAAAGRRVMIGEPAGAAGAGGLAATGLGLGARGQESPSRPHTGHQRALSTQPSTSASAAAAAAAARRKTRQGPPVPRSLDDCLACHVSDDAWEGLGDAEVKVEEDLHIAEKFRLAYEEQDARLRAKAQREAAQAERRVTGAARVVAEWLDAE